MVDSPRSYTGARWVLNEVRAERVEAMARSTGLSPTAASVLSSRWKEEGDPRDWLSPSIDHLHDPGLMLHMPEAVARLQQAVRDRQRIRVVTDYDVDGTTSSLILQAALRVLDPQIDVSYHIPNRFDEGYGFSVRAAEKAAEDGIGLVVTADIGVRDHAAIDAARARGVDVLVCDHHLPAGASVPGNALVLCPPQSGDTYPNRSLAACGVSLKLAQALLGGHAKRDALVKSMLKLAAIGTVADMVSLGTPENRAIVALGLGELNHGAHTPGLQALLDVCGLERGRISEGELGFRIGPRINAAGRLADAALVVDLLATRDPALAAEKAQHLDSLNTARRDLQRQLVTEAVAKVAEAPKPFVVLSGQESEGWHRGVVGIVAARVKDEVNRPVAIVSIQGELAVGSVRSIREIHAVRALESVSDLLVKFGGHPAAAGFTVRTADLPALERRLCDYVEQTVAVNELVPLHHADALVPAEAVDDRLRRELDRLGPFGMGNPSPHLIVPNVRPMGMQVKGAEQRMLKFLVPRPRGGAVEAIWWDGASLLPALANDTIDLLVKLDENTWNGETRLQLDVKDARPAVG